MPKRDAPKSKQQKKKAKELFGEKFNNASESQNKVSDFGGIPERSLKKNLGC